MARMRNDVDDSDDNKRVPIPMILVSQQDGDDTITRTMMSKDEDVDNPAPSIFLRKGI
jgi:hypothetical protein